MHTSRWRWTGSRWKHIYWRYEDSFNSCIIVNSTPLKFDQVLFDLIKYNKKLNNVHCSTRSLTRNLQAGTLSVTPPLEQPDLLTLYPQDSNGTLSVACWIKTYTESRTAQKTGDLWWCINVCQRIKAQFLWTVAALLLHT